MRKHTGWNTNPNKTKTRAAEKKVSARSNEDHDVPKRILALPILPGQGGGPTGVTCLYLPNHTSTGNVYS